MPAKEKSVILETFGDLLAHGYRLNGTCRGCRVNRDIDLARCPAGQSYIGRRFRCRDCGSGVLITLSKIITGGDGHLAALDRWREK